MKRFLVDMAVITITAGPIQVHREDEAQQVLISGRNASGNKAARGISKVTHTMPTMQECVEAGKAWMSEKDVASGNGWRRYECSRGF